jgi:tetratricopeptide (TPR) repeat protein
LYLVGLFAKESAVTLPAVLALDDWLRRRELRREGGALLPTLAKKYGPLVLALAVYLAFRMNAVAGDAQIWPGWVNVSAGDRILTASRVMLEYIAMFVFPKTLLAHYWKRDVPLATSVFEPLVMLSIVAWVSVVALSVRYRNRDPLLVFAVAWFFVTLAPVSNIAFPIGVGKAERILYLPSVGLCLVVGWAMMKAEARLRSPLVYRAAIACVLLALTVRTIRRNAEWRDNLTLANATLAVSPTSPLMNALAASDLLLRGDTKRATEMLRVAVREAPDMALLQNYLGEALRRQGLIDEAIVAYREAIRANPKDATAVNNLGVAYRDKGMEAEALAQFQLALRLNPRYADPHVNIGSAFMKTGQLAQAEAAFSAAVRADPLNANAHNALGAAYTGLGQLDRAAEQFREALRINPNDPHAKANLELVTKPNAVAPPRVP